MSPWLLPNTISHEPVTTLNTGRARSDDQTGPETMVTTSGSFRPFTNSGHVVYPTRRASKVIPRGQRRGKQIVYSTRVRSFRNESVFFRRELTTLQEGNGLLGRAVGKVKSVLGLSPSRRQGAPIPAPETPTGSELQNVVPFKLDREGVTQIRHSTGSRTPKGPIGPLTPDPDTASLVQRNRRATDRAKPKSGDIEIVKGSKPTDVVSDALRRTDYTLSRSLLDPRDHPDDPHGLE
jgi:hypothetical protein